ncbi:MAG: ABC transporter ATP-binding protein [Candidatus Latescibacterota bacterium]
MTTTQSENAQYALSISSARKSFGTVQVLKGVDLGIEPGERIALMGPSGSGKSTLLNCISGIEKLDSGTITLHGQVISDLDGGGLEKLRRESIGYVFQSFHLLPTLTAFENIELPAQLINMPKDERREKVYHMLKSVGLSHRSDHKPDALSGGERQRVAIGRALIHSPGLVLADEPTGSLDTQSGEDVLALLEKLSVDQGVALLMVTHDRSSARICNRVISIQDGLLI